MDEPEHISKPVRRVMEILEVVYKGDAYDEAIKRRLRELGSKADRVKTIICIPEAIGKGKDKKQLSLFD